MKIIKYKKIGSNKYELILDNNEKIKLYEDVILKENLLWKKEINDLDNLLKINSEYEIYDIALRRLSNHVESKMGMSNYLLKKGYDNKKVLETIDKLINMGYLNDNYYAKCYVSDHVNLSMDGPRKTIKHLEDLEISYNDYDEYLSYDNEFWKERINHYLEKQLKVNKKSLYIFKNKMLINLINLGYDKDLINSCLNNITIDNQDELKMKEKEKIRIKLSRKYTGDELERKIKEKLYQKGFFD